MMFLIYRKALLTTKFLKHYLNVDLLRLLDITIYTVENKALSCRLVTILLSIIIVILSIPQMPKY